MHVCRLSVCRVHCVQFENIESLEDCSWHRGNPRDSGNSFEVKRSVRIKDDVVGKKSFYNKEKHACDNSFYCFRYCAPPLG